MELYLVRHAAAVDRAEASSDEARTLTARGSERFARVVRGLDRIGVRLDVVRHSPWTRAVETADLLMPLCRGESIADTARVLSRYLDGLVVRTFDHGTVEEWARQATIPGDTDCPSPLRFDATAPKPAAVAPWRRFGAPRRRKAKAGKSALR